LTTFIWNNYQSKSDWRSWNLIPKDFLPSLALPTSYLSGTILLDKLLTLVDVIYSPLYLDNGDDRVKVAIENYLSTSNLITKKSNTGPFIKLVKALSFAFADYNNTIDVLETLNDLKKCPDEYLPLLANLIGWDLFGTEPDRWRLQISNAVNIYKSTGTKKSIQFAVDSVLGQDVFNVSSTITELWESYVPFIIEYALATESSLLKDFTTWTPEIASRLGIGYFNPSSMEENVKLCVDQIIYDLVLSFSSSFILGNSTFPVGSQEFTFNYRGRVFQIPPYEEYPYYINCQLSNQMIDVIFDRIVCFGVNQSFATQVLNYLKQKSLDTTNDFAIKSSWLFFTPSIEYPPNWDAIIQDISNNKSEYLPLWNGKSSRFKIVLDASSFDFSKTSLEANSRETLYIASKVAQQFSPAHSIPNVIAKIAYEDNYFASSVPFTYLGYDRIESPQLSASPHKGTSTYGASAIPMSTYKRGLTATSVATFSRKDVDSILDPLLNPNTAIVQLPRTAFRRRNLKNIFPKDGFYSKTGDNQPSPLYPHNKDKWVPNPTLHFSAHVELPVFYLGLIPSSLQWVPIPDYNNLPPIYNICENLSSVNVYSGLIVSATMPVRGWRKVGSNAKITENGVSSDYYYDFNQLHPFAYTVHYLQEQKKLQEASAYYYSNQNDYTASSYWFNVLDSRANELTESSGAFPNSFDDYINFEFGKDFHKLYYEYTHAFNRHRLGQAEYALNGPTIFSHMFGSILFNSDFKYFGVYTETAQMITSSLSNVIELTAKPDGLFAISGSYLASSILNVGSSTYELRNSGILSHIEFSQPSGASTKNSFSILAINQTYPDPIRRNEFLVKNRFIKQVSNSGLGRIIFDISKYPHAGLYFDNTYNFLSPDHKFKFNLNSLISNQTGQTLGGGTVGVWIHTRPENNKVWSYLKDIGWFQHDASSVTESDVINSYCNLYTLPQKSRPIIQKENKFLCADIVDPENPNLKNDIISTFTEKDFEVLQLDFDTLNENIKVPSEYQDLVSNKVHRLDQKYVIEIFTVPTQDEKFTLYYGPNLQDLTLNKWSKIFVSGISNGSLYGEKYSKEFRIDVPKYHIINIFKYFNQITGAYNTAKQSNLTGYASRSSTISAPLLGASGGSRITYVEDPFWTNAYGGYIEEAITLKN
jgi:hypothetical protein